MVVIYLEVHPIHTQKPQQMCLYVQTGNFPEPKRYFHTCVGAGDQKFTDTQGNPTSQKRPVSGRTNPSMGLAESQQYRLTQTDSAIEQQQPNAKVPATNSWYQLTGASWLSIYYGSLFYLSSKGSVNGEAHRKFV